MPNLPHHVVDPGTAGDESHCGAGTFRKSENLVHIPRVLIGGISAGSVECTLDVLAGNYPAKGVLTHDVQFK